MPSFKFECRGHTMHNRKFVLQSYLSSIQQDITNSYLKLIPEPKNKFDPNAIQIISKGEIYGQIGYVGREYTNKVKEIIKKDPLYEVKILTQNPTESPKSILLELTYDV